MRPTPDSSALALTRTLLVVAIIVSAAIGRHQLMEGKRLEQKNAQIVGPAGPDFSAFTTTLSGYVMLALSGLILLVTIVVWLRSPHTRREIAEQPPFPVVPPRVRGAPSTFEVIDDLPNDDDA